MYKLFGKVFLFGVVFMFTACFSQPEVYDREILPVFKKYNELNQKFLKTVDSDPVNHKKAREEVESYTMKEYNVALKLFEKEYCKNPQADVLDEFVAVLLSSTNSASELPAYALGVVYKCQQAQVMPKIDSMDKQQRQTLIKILKSQGIEADKK